MRNLRSSCRFFSCAHHTLQPEWRGADAKHGGGGVQGAECRGKKGKARESSRIRSREAQRAGGGEGRATGFGRWRVWGMAAAGSHAHGLCLVVLLLMNAHSIRHPDRLGGNQRGQRMQKIKATTRNYAAEQRRERSTERRRKTTVEGVSTGTGGRRGRSNGWHGPGEWKWTDPFLILFGLVHLHFDLQTRDRRSLLQARRLETRVGDQGLGASCRGSGSAEVAARVHARGWAGKS